MEPQQASSQRNGQGISHGPLSMRQVNLVQLQSPVAPTHCLTLPQGTHTPAPCSHPATPLWCLPYHISYHFQGINKEGWDGNWSRLPKRTIGESFTTFLQHQAAAKHPRHKEPEPVLTEPFLASHDRLARVLPQRGIFCCEQISRNDLIHLPASEEAEQTGEFPTPGKSSSVKRWPWVSWASVEGRRCLQTLPALYSECLRCFLKGRLKCRKIKWINRSEDGQRLWSKSPGSWGCHPTTHPIPLVLEPTGQTCCTNNRSGTRRGPANALKCVLSSGSGLSYAHWAQCRAGLIVSCALWCPWHQALCLAHSRWPIHL